MNKELEKLYEVYQKVKTDNYRDYVPSRVKKGDIIKVIYEDHQYPAEWYITAMSDSSLNRYDKERVRYYYEGILGDAEWDGEKWISNWRMCFH